MSTINDTDQFLIQRGTTSHKQSAVDLMSTIQDTDLMLVQRGTQSFKVTCEDVKDQLGGGDRPEGVVNKPSVLEPNDGAGSGDLKHLKSDAITAIAGGGVKTCETETISAVDTVGYTPAVGAYVKVSGGDATGDAFTNIENAWDGDESTWAYFNYTSYSGTGADHSRYSWAFVTPIPCTELKALVASYSSDSRSFVGFNGQPGKQGADKNSGPPALVDFSDSITDGFLRSFEIGDVGSNYGLLYAVYVDGRVLVNPLNCTVLTFPNSDEFGCFNVGNVVQGNSVTSSKINVYDPAGNLLSDTDYVLTGKAVELAGGDSDEEVINKLFFDEDNLGGGALCAYKPSAYTGDMSQTTALADMRTIEFIFDAPVNIAKDRPGEQVYVVVFGGHKVYVDDVEAGDTSILSTAYVDIKDYLPFRKLKLVPQDNQGGSISQTGFYGLRDDPGVYFNLGDDSVKVISKDSSANTITVDGGEWTGSDGSGTPDKQTKLVKETAYSTTLTVAGPTDLTDAFTGGSWMTDGTTGADSKYTQTPYKLTTSQITDVKTGVITTRGDWGINFVCRDTGNNSLVEWELLGNPDGTTSLDVALRAFNGDPADMARGQRGPSGQYAYGSFEPSGGVTIVNELAINNNVYSYFYWILELGGVTARLELEDYDGNTDNPEQKYKWLKTSAFAGQTISASNPLKIKCFTLNDQQENTTVAAIQIDGELLIDNSFPDPAPDPDKDMLQPTTVLTFADPCLDLQYFKEGDVVQSRTYSANKLVIDLGNFSDNFYLESVYVDGKLLWDSADFPEAPKNVVTGQLITDYLEISGATSNGTSKASFWANGKVGGGPNGGITDTPWRAYNSGAKAVVEWTETINFKTITLWVSQGSDVQANGEVELPDTTVVATFVMPGSIATFVESEGVSTGSVEVIAPPDVANRKLTVDGGEWRVGAGETPTQFSVRKSSDTTSPPDLTWETIGDSNQETIQFSDASKYPSDTSTYGTFIYDLGVTTADVYWHHRTDTAGIGASHQLWASSDGSNWTKVDEGDGVKIRLFSGSDTFRYLLAVRTDFAGMSASNWSIDPSSFEADDHVEYQTNGGQGNVISVDSDNNEILIQDTGNRDNRWIADNQAGTDFAVAGPEFVDKPLLTADVWLKSSAFATTPEGIDGLKGIIWKLNGVEQPETTDNPYKPTGLAIETFYTVEVRHVGFLLGISEWSTATTFETGRTRNLRDYYETKIAELEAKNS